MMDGAARRIASTAAFESFAFQAIRIGPIAADSLARPRAGRVIAVFDRGFYIAFGAELVFLGAADLAMGPLNLSTSAPERTSWKLGGARIDDRVTVTDEYLIVGSRFRFALADVPVWQPEPAPVTLDPVTPSPADVSRGLAGFREAADGRLPLEGLGSLVGRATDEAPLEKVMARARPCVRELRDWLVEAFRGRETPPAPDCAGLIGLGPGLTPSGDDFIGGVWIAAHELRAEEVAHRLWGLIQPRLDATNGISRGHLRAAARGFGQRDIHDAIGAMLKGRADDYRALIDGIDGIGHSSGWDAIAGVTQTLDAWLVSRSSP